LILLVAITNTTIAITIAIGMIGMIGMIGIIAIEEIETIDIKMRI